MVADKEQLPPNCHILPEVSIAGTSIGARIRISLAALGITWFVSGVGLGLRVGDGVATFAFFLWSIPMFLVGWMILGIPIIAMGDRIDQAPTIVLGIAGAIAGAVVMFLPAMIIWTISPGVEHFNIDLPYLKGWPSFGAAIGGGAAILYRWILSSQLRKSSK